MGKQAFHGTLHGNGPTVSRCGSKANGIDAMVHGWDGGVYVRLWRDGDTDMVRILCGPHGSEAQRVLYNGPMGDLHREGLLVQAAKTALERECA